MRILVELRDGDWRDRSSFQVLETMRELMLDALASQVRRHLRALGHSGDFVWTVPNERPSSAVHDGEIEQEP